MNRDLNKLIAEGKTLIRNYERYDLSVMDINTLLLSRELAEISNSKQARDTLFTLVTTSYAAGVATGARLKKAHLI